MKNEKPEKSDQEIVKEQGLELMQALRKVGKHCNRFCKKMQTNLKRRVKKKMRKESRRRNRNV